MTTKQSFQTILCLGLLTSLGPFTIDMYLPGFNAIADNLNTSVANVSHTLSSYFVGISAGQLLYGPLLDKFGRKKPLYLGLMIYIITSIACAFVVDIESFIALRFFQAVGSCAATVSAMTMVRDLFPVKDTPKIYAKLMLVIGLSPMLAPTIGGYVIASFSWQAIFYILGFMGFGILLIAKFALPSNYQPNPEISLKPKPILLNFKSIISHPQFYTYVITGAISFSGLFTYVASSPIIFMEVFQIDEKMYGWIFAFLSISFIGASQLNSYLLKKYTSQQLIYASLILQILYSTLFCVGIYFELLNIYGVILMLFLYLSCLGLSNPNTAGLALAPFSYNTGSASSLMGAIQMGLGALASYAVAVFVTDSILPITIIFLSSSFLAMFVLLIGRRNISKSNLNATHD